MIPKIIHIIWVGDDSLRPDNSIMTWVKHHPDWTIKLWGNEELENHPWTNANHMVEMASRNQLCGVADLMRLEILYQEGGFYVDADSLCIKPLENWLFQSKAFACWENEIAVPGLIANTYIAAEPHNEFIGQMILDLQAMPVLPPGPAWSTVGPLFLTNSYRKYKYNDMVIWPSHLFLPTHHTGQTYKGDPISFFATHEWGTTHNSYSK